jgi:hypothetical protein
MNRKRLTIAFVSTIALAIPLLVVMNPSAMAQATQVRIPVSWTLTPGAPPTGCPSLSVVVTGTGEVFSVTNHRIDQNGVDHIDTNTLATGSATDSDGATYGWNYHNHVSLEVSPGGFPFQITLGSDHFNLEGKGRANQLHVHFVARATFLSPAAPPIIEFVNLHGAAFGCDPI